MTLYLFGKTIWQTNSLDLFWPIHRSEHMAITWYMPTLPLLSSWKVPFCTSMLVGGRVNLCFWFPPKHQAQRVRQVTAIYFTRSQHRKPQGPVRPGAHGSDRGELVGCWGGFGVWGGFGERGRMPSLSFASGFQVYLSCPN